MHPLTQVREAGNWKPEHPCPCGCGATLPGRYVDSFDARYEQEPLGMFEHPRWGPTRRFAMDARRLIGAANLELLRSHGLWVAEGGSTLPVPSGEIPRKLDPAAEAGIAVCALCGGLWRVVGADRALVDPEHPTTVFAGPDLHHSPARSEDESHKVPRAERPDARNERYREQ